MIKTRLFDFLFQKIRHFAYFQITPETKKERMIMFCERLNVQPAETILDIGAGSGEMWKKYCPYKDLKIIGLDIYPVVSSIFRSFVVGDARFLPFKDKSVDVVFSNSVLEHVGDYLQQALMASEIQRVAKKFFIQTPNKSFPIEPHFFIPYFPYFPKRLQIWLCKNLFNVTGEVNLITEEKAKKLFPDAQIEKERFMGLCKSFYIYGSVKRLEGVRENRGRGYERIVDS